MFKKLVTRFRKKVIPPEPPPLITEFRVKAYGGTGCYVLEYMCGGEWVASWKVYNVVDYLRPDRMKDLAPSPDPLIKRGEHYKRNPGSFEKYLKSEEKKLSKLLDDWNLRKGEIERKKAEEERKRKEEKERKASFIHYIQ